MYDGLSYLNQEQQIFLKQKLSEGTFSDYVISTLDIDENNNIHEICNSFANWIKTVSEKDVYSIRLQHNNERFIYALNLEIRKKFSNAWCFKDGDIVSFMGIVNLTLCENSFTF